LRKKKLLIVEDDTVQIQVLAAKLRTSGFDVVVARDGVQSISLIRQQRPDLILLDIGLPAGDGYVVLQRMKALTLAVPLPVIALSSRPAETEREKMLAAGAADYFEKPIEYERLTKKIKELLGDIPW
jgi:DNA-binding response OmpR family regulator